MVLYIDTTFKNASALEMAHEQTDFYAEPSHVPAAQAAMEVETSISACTPFQPEAPITSPPERNTSSAALVGIRDRCVRQKMIQVTAVHNLAIRPNAVGPANKARSVRVRQ